MNNVPEEIGEMQEAVWDILHDRPELRGFNFDRLRRANTDLKRAQIESQRKEKDEPARD